MHMVTMDTLYVSIQIPFCFMINPHIYFYPPPFNKSENGEHKNRHCPSFKNKMNNMLSCRASVYVRYKQMPLSGNCPIINTQL